MTSNPFNPYGAGGTSDSASVSANSTKSDVSTSDSSDDEDLLKNLAETLVGGNKTNTVSSPVRNVPPRPSPMRLTRFKKDGSSNTSHSTSQTSSRRASVTAKPEPNPSLMMGQNVISPLSLKSTSPVQQQQQLLSATPSNSPSQATTPIASNLSPSTGFPWAVDSNLATPLRQLLKETRSLVLKIASDEEGPVDAEGEAHLYGATRTKWEQLMSGIESQHQLLIKKENTITNLQTELQTIKGQALLTDNDKANRELNNRFGSAAVTGQQNAVSHTKQPTLTTSSDSNVTSIWRSAVLALISGITDPSSRSASVASSASSHHSSARVNETKSNETLSDLCIKAAIELSSTNARDSFLSTNNNHPSPDTPSFVVDTFRQLEKFQNELLELRQIRNELYSSQQDKASTIEEQSLELINATNEHNAEMKKLKEEVGELLQRSAVELEETKEALGQLQQEYDDLLSENQSLKAAISRLNPDELKQLNETFTSGGAGGSPTRSLGGSPPQDRSLLRHQGAENDSDSSPPVARADHHAISSAKYENENQELRKQNEELLAALVALKSKVAEDEAHIQNRIREKVNNTDLEKQVQELQSTIESLRSELEERNASFFNQKGDHTNEIQALNLTILAMKTEITEKEDRIADLEQNIDALKMQVEKAENATEDAKDEQQKLLEQLQEMSSKNQTKTENDPELTAARAMIEELESRLGTARQEISDLRFEINETKSQSETGQTVRAEELKQALKEAQESKTSMARLEGENEKLQKQFDHLKDRYEAQLALKTEETLAETQTQNERLTAANAMVEELEARLENSRDEISKLRREQTQFNEEIAKLTNSLNESKQAEVELKAQLQSVQTEFSSQRIPLVQSKQMDEVNGDSKTLTSNEAELTQLRLNLTNLQEVHNKQNNHITQLKEENEKLRSENINVSQKCKDAESNTNYVSSQPKAAQERVQELEVELQQQQISSQSSNHVAQIAALEAQVEELRRSHQAYLDFEAEAQEEGARHINEMAETERYLSEEIASLKATLQTKEEEIRVLKLQIQNEVDHQHILDEHKNLYAQAQHEITRLNEVVTHLEATLDQERARFQELAEEQTRFMSQRESEQEKLLTSLDGWKAQKDQWKEKMSVLERTNSELSSQILRENELAKSGRSSEVGFDSLRRDYDVLQEDKIELSKANQDLRIEIIDLKAKITEQENYIKSLSAQLISQDLSYRSTIDEKDKIILTLSQATQIHDEAQRASVTALESLSSEVAALKDNLREEKESGSTSSLKEIGALKESLQAAKLEHAVEIESLRAKELEARKQVQNVESKLADANEELSLLREEQTKLTTSIVPKLNSQITELNETIAHLRQSQAEQSKSVENDLEKSLMTISQLNEKVRSLEKQIKDLHTTEKLLNAEKEELINALKKAMDSGGTDELKNDEIFELKRKLESVERGLFETETEYKSEKNQSAQLRKDLQKLKVETEHRDRESATRIKELEDQLKQTKNKITKLSAAAEGKDTKQTSELEGLKIDMAALRKESQVAEQQIANMETEIEGLKRKLVAAQKELLDKSEELKMANANAQTNGDLLKRVTHLQQQISDAETLKRAEEASQHAAEVANNKHKRAIAALKADLEQISADNVSQSSIHEHMSHHLVSTSAFHVNSSVHSSSSSVGRQRQGKNDLPSLRAAHAASIQKENDSIAILSRQLSDAARTQNLREQELQRARHEIESLRRQLLVKADDVSSPTIGGAASANSSPARLSLSEEERKYREERDRLNEHIFALEKQLRIIKQDSADIHLARTDAELAGQQLADELNRLEIQMANHKAENLRIRSEQDLLQQDFSGKIAQLEKDLLEQKNVNSELQSHNHKLQELLKRRSQELILSEEVVNDLENKISGRDKDFSHTKRQLNDALSTVQALETENERLITALEASKKEVSAARKQVADIKLSYAEHDSETSTLKSRLASQERAIDHLKADLQEAESLSTERTSTLSRLQKQKHDDHSRLVHNVEEVHEELAAAKEALITLKADLKDAQLEVTSLRNELKESHTSASKQKEALAQRDEAVKEAKRRVAELTETNEKLRGDVGHLQSQAKELVRLEAANAALTEELEQCRTLVDQLTDIRTQQIQQIKELESRDTQSSHSDSNALAEAKDATIKAESKLASALADNALLRNDIVEMKIQLERAIASRGELEDQLATTSKEYEKLRREQVFMSQGRTTSTTNNPTVSPTRSRSPSIQSVVSSSAAEFKAAANAIGATQEHNAPSATSYAFLIKCLARFQARELPIVHHGENASLSDLSLANVLPEAVQAAERLQRGLEELLQTRDEARRLANALATFTEENKQMISETAAAKAAASILQSDLDAVRVERDRLLLSISAQNEHVQQLRKEIEATHNPIASARVSPPHSRSVSPPPPPVASTIRGTAATLDIGDIPTRHPPRPVTGASTPTTATRPPFNTSTKSLTETPTSATKKLANPTTTAAAQRRQPVASPYRGAHGPNASSTASAAGSRSASNAAGSSNVPLLSNNSEAARIAQLISDAMRNRDKVGPVNSTTSSHAAAAPASCPEAAAVLLIIAPPLIEDLISMHLAAREDYNSYLEDCSKHRMKPTRVTTRGFELSIKQLETSLLYLKKILTCALTYSDLDATKNPSLLHPTSSATIAFSTSVLESLRVFIVTIVHISNTFCDPLPVEEVLLEGFTNTISKHLKAIDTLESQHQTTLVAAASASPSRSTSQTAAAAPTTGGFQASTASATTYNYYRQHQSQNRRVQTGITSRYE